MSFIVFFMKGVQTTSQACKKLENQSTIQHKAQNFKNAKKRLTKRLGLCPNRLDHLKIQNLNFGAQNKRMRDLKFNATTTSNNQLPKFSAPNWLESHPIDCTKYIN